ncbi:hypothetical protein AB1E18_002659 [Capra hircus]
MNIKKYLKHLLRLRNGDKYSRGRQKNLPDWREDWIPGGQLPSQEDPDLLKEPNCVYNTGARSSGACSSEVQDSGFVPLQGIRGGSVLIHVIKKQEAEPEEVSWAFAPESNYRDLLRVCHGADTPTLYFQHKYQQRIYVPNAMSLRIENLTQEDNPVPLPQIMLKSASITPDWCNATLECRASGDTEDLKVTWESKGLLRELEQKTLSVSLLLSQPSISLTCVVSNQVDQKTATLDLGEVRARGPHAETSAAPLRGILGAVVAMLLILGGGLYLWKICGKEKNKESGMWIQKDHAGGIYYLEPIPLGLCIPQLTQEPCFLHHEGFAEQCLEEKESFTSVFGEVHTQAMS